MPIEFTTPELTELKPKITVIGVGGAGGNAVNNMIAASLQGVDFVVSNTDAQALAHSAATQRIQLGAQLTQGLGAGARPEVGKAAAEETMEQIDDYLAGSHMVFITAGMGGGTGTGAAPVIAQRAREKGMLTVGVVTKPFQFEGSKRMRLAEEGIKELQQHVDTLIIIPNQNLFRIANEKTTFADAFVMADEVLNSGVRGVTDLIVMPGLVNLDFADVRTVMSEMGKAMMGTGEAEGENRALEAAEAAISNPLLDEVSMKGARGVLINITGGMDLTLFEVDEAANRIRAEVDPDANILVGSALDETLDGRMRVSVVATGIEAGSGDALRDHAQYFSSAAQGQVSSSPTRNTGNTETSLLSEADMPETGDVETLQLVDEAPVEDVPATTTTTKDFSFEALDQTPQMDMPAADANDLTAAQAKDVRFPSSIKVDDLGDDMPFIAPEAQMPKQRLQTPIGQADPFAEAAMENGPAEPEKGSRGLFSRLTGKRRKDKAMAKQAAVPAPSQPELPVGGDPVAHNPMQKQGVSGKAESRETGEGAVAAQPVKAPIGRLDPKDRISPSVSDDDQLEIPAFLRRQAN